MKYCTLLLLLTIVFTSCVDTKKLARDAVYFQSVTDSSLRQSVTEYQTTIQKGDILSISVSTANESSARLLNMQTIPVSGSASAGSLPADGAVSLSGGGYLVDNEGNIIFPVIGKVHVGGLNRSTVSDTITSRIRPLVSDAIVAVRLVNFKITVLGEVLRPGNMSVPTDRVSILDALGLAGDLTSFARRDNIKVIREVNGKREMGVLNLRTGDIFNSPYFYLKQNDVVYVEMTDRKMANVDQASFRNISIGLGVITALALVVTTISNIN